MTRLNVTGMKEEIARVGGESADIYMYISAGGGGEVGYILMQHQRQPQFADQLL